MIKSKKLKRLVNLIKTRKDNYFNFECFVFYMFKLQKKIVFVPSFTILLNRKNNIQKNALWVQLFY